MAALMYLRAINLKVRFFLGMDVAFAGEFNHIFLRYQPQDPDVDEVRLLVRLIYKDKGDLTLSEQDLSAREGDFSLNKCFNTYCEVMQDIEFTKHMKNTYFVVITNSTVDMKLTNHARSSDHTLDNILDTSANAGNVRRFNILHDADICLSFKEHPMAARFLSNFVLCSKQASEHEVNSLIRCEIMRYYAAPLRNIHEVCNNILLNIRDWWYRKCSRPQDDFLTENWQCWDTIRNSNLSRRTLLCQMNFQRDLVEHLASRILDSDCSLVSIVYNGVGMELRCLKVIQALLTQHERGVLFTSANEPEDNLALTLGLWSKGPCDVFVVDTATSSYGNWNFSERLGEVLDRNPTKRLLLVSGTSDCTFVKSMKKNHKGGCTELKDTCEFGHLDVQSRELILDLRVMFQGCESSLRSFSDIHVLGAVLKGNVMSNFLNFKAIHTFGNTLEQFQIYRGRKIEKKVIINAEMFSKDDISDVFMVSGVTQDELKDLSLPGQNVYQFHECKDCSVRYITAIQSKHLTADGQFLLVCQYINNKPVHWIDKQNDDFIWKQSLGDTKNLCNYIQTTSREAETVRQMITQFRTCSVTADDVVSANIRTVIVSGEAGMGKSFLLSQVAHIMKQRDPSLWVLQLKCTDVVKHLEETDPSAITSRTVHALLAAATNVSHSTCPELAVALIEDTLQNRGNIAILLDGFDEIKSTCIPQMLYFLRILRRSKLNAMWVTTTNVMREKLEEELTSPAFTLQPFNFSEQIDFLVGLWGDEKQELPYQFLQSRVKKFLYLVCNIFKLDNGKSVCSIPWILTMLAEEYKELVLTDDFDNISTSLNVNDLYKKCIERKVHVLCRENNEDILSREDYSRFMDIHMACALVALLNNEELYTLQKKGIHDKIRPILQAISRGQEKSAIVIGIIHGKPQFIHRTFAEYFVAHWFVENRHINMSYINILLFNPRFHVVRNVFNRILATNCPLHVAVMNNDQLGLNAALACGVDSTDAGGRTPLHLAVQNETWKATVMVDLLLKHGANIDASDTMLQCTPIQYAVKAEAWETVKFLLRKGAQVDNNIGEQELVQQVIRIAVEKSYIHEVPQAGIDINWTVFDNNYSVEEKSILHLASQCGHLRCVEMLLEKGADVNTFTGKKQTPLHYAVKERHVDVARHLLSSGADVNLSNNRTRTPLHYACRLRYTEMVTLLLDNGADPNARTSEGETPLHESLQNIEIVKLLVERNADINASGLCGYSPVCCAVVNGSVNILNYFVTIDANFTLHNIKALHLASELGHEKIVEILLNAGANIRARDYDNRTALHVATLYGHPGIVQLLISHGAKIKYKDSRGNTALHTACNMRNDILVQYLVAHAPRKVFSLQNSAGDTALHIACRNANETAVRCLITHCRNKVFYIKNTDGHTPMNDAQNEMLIDLQEELKRRSRYRVRRYIQRLFR